MIREKVSLSIAKRLTEPRDIVSVVVSRTVQRTGAVDRFCEIPSRAFLDAAPGGVVCEEARRTLIDAARGRVVSILVAAAVKHAL